MNEISWDVSIATDGPLTTGTGNFFGVLNAQTSAGPLKVTVTLQPDPVRLIVSSPGLFLGNPSLEGGARKLVELSDGSLVLVGNLGPNSGIVHLTRLTSQGLVDRSYASNNTYATVQWMSEFDAVTQKDDKVLVAGFDPSNKFSGYLVRFTKSGALDGSFSEDGRVTVPWGDRLDGTWVHAVEVQADGKIVVVGRASVLRAGSSNQYELDFGVARFNADGTLDTSFNGRGWTTIQLGGTDIARGVSVQADGKLIIGGYTTAYGNVDFAAVRLNADGSPDKTFGTSGTAILSMPERNESAYGGVTLLKSGKFLLAGSSQTVTSQGLPEGLGLVARFNADGSLDTSFGANGLAKIDFASLPDPIDILAYDVTERADGTLSFTGNVSVEGNPRYAFAAQLLADGRLDSSFGQGGTVLNGLGQSIGSLVTKDGGFIFGSATRGTEFSFDVPAKTKLLSNGQVDLSFNPNPVFTPGGVAIGLNHLVSMYDADAFIQYPAVEWSYAGTTLTIQRAGTASVDDRFGGLGSVSFVDTTLDPSDRGLLKVGDVAIGTYEQANGKLSITFNSDATQARVDDALSGLTYRNAGTSAPAELKLLVSVSDATSTDQASLTLLNAALPAPGKGVSGLAYHWKSHALLSGVTVSVGDQKAVEANNDLFDLRAASFDAATGVLTVQLWANPTQASSTFDVTAITQSAKSASFTPSLSSASWTVLANTDKPNEVSISGFLSNPAASGVTGSIQLGTLTLTLPPNAPVTVNFKNLLVGGTVVADAALTLASSATAADGKYSLALADGSHSLAVTRAVGDGSTNHGITSADALAALKIAVGINPNTDPDGTGPLQIPMLSPYQVMAADVNRDGKVTSADALAILKMSVKLSDAPTPSWMFVEEKRDFWDEATKAFTLTRNAASWDSSINLALPSAASTNLVGVLKGDVNGSWTLPGATTIESTNPTYFKDLAQLIGVPADQWGIPPGG
jgi:uncharacterized delta-60 repeat protein